MKTVRQYQSNTQMVAHIVAQNIVENRPFGVVAVANYTGANDGEVVTIKDREVDEVGREYSFSEFETFQNCNMGNVVGATMRDTTDDLANDYLMPHEMMVSFSEKQTQKLRSMIANTFRMFGVRNMNDYQEWKSNMLVSYTPERINEVTIATDCQFNIVEPDISLIYGTNDIENDSDYENADTYELLNFRYNKCVELKIRTCSTTGNINPDDFETTLDLLVKSRDEHEHVYIRLPINLDELMGLAC